MPCDTIQRSTVKLELKVENKAYLITALKSLGYTVVESGLVLRLYKGGIEATLSNGKLTVNGSSYAVEAFDLNEIKRAYSMQVVQAAAKAFNWKTKRTGDFKFKVQKVAF